MTVQALASGSVAFDASGRGVVSLAPDRAHTWWKITRMVTSTSDGSAATLSVYRTFIAPSALLDSTLKAGGDSSETDIDIGPGDSLQCVYTGGTPGVTGTIVVSGELQGRV